MTNARVDFFGQAAEINGVKNGNQRSQSDQRQDLFLCGLVHEFDRIGETGGFNENDIRLEGGDVLDRETQGAANRAANAAIGHFPYGVALPAQQLAIDVDLPILVHHNRRFEPLGQTIVQEAAQEGCLATAQKAGNQMDGDTLGIRENNPLFLLVHSVNSIPGFTSVGKAGHGPAWFHEKRPTAHVGLFVAAWSVAISGGFLCR